MTDYQAICGGFSPIDCSNMLLQATEHGGDIPPLPADLEYLISQSRGGSAANYLEDLQAATLLNPDNPAQPQATDIGLPLPFFVMAAIGLSAWCIQYAADRLSGGDDLEDDLEAWEKQLEAIPDPIAPLPPTAPRSAKAIAPIDLPDTDSADFDWAILHDCDRHPHLLILGKTGAGKTTLARRLLADWGGNALVITPHAKPGEWGSIDVKGAGRNYGEIGRAIAAIVAEMNRRYQLYSAGVEDYPTWSIVIDEIPAIMANCADAGGHLKELAREARKVKIRLLILSQGAEVKALGIEGEGSVRESFTRILLRGFTAQLPPSLQSRLARYEYPCLVNGAIADTNNLPELGTVEPLQADCEASLATQRERLEAAYNGAATRSGQPAMTDNEATYGPDNLTASQVCDRVAQLRKTGLSQTKTIETIWGVRAGSNAGYLSARAEYKSLMGE